MDLPDLQKQGREWEAWQIVVAEWRRLLPELDMNDAQCNPLFRAIEVWAEYLVMLRMTQYESDREAARIDKMSMYRLATENR